MTFDPTKYVHGHCVRQPLPYCSQSCAQPPSCMREKGYIWSKGLHFLVLKARILLRPNQVAESWSHDISGMQLCMVLTYARALKSLAFAHGTKVAVSFYFTHTRIANYCIPAGRVSATLLTRSFLPFWVAGAGARD